MKGKAWITAISCAASAGCGVQNDAVEPASDPTTFDREELTLPAWTETSSERPSSMAQGPSSQPRSFETRVLAAGREADPLASVLRGKGGKRVKNLSLHQAPVAEVLRMLASTGGFNLVIADGVPDRRITIELKNVTLHRAFEAVLAAAQLQAEPIGSEIVLVKVASAGP